MPKLSDVKKALIIGVQAVIIERGEGPGLAHSFGLAFFKAQEYHAGLFVFTEMAVPGVGR